MSLKKGGVIDNGGQQGRKGPQEQSRKELGDYRILADQIKKWKKRKSLRLNTKFIIMRSLGYGHVYTYVQILHGLGNIKLVHGGDDDSRSCKKEEQEEKETVDDQATDPP